MEVFEGIKAKEMATICAAIRIRRLNLGLTQEYVADRLKISQNCYHKIESGKSTLKVKTLLDLASILDVTPGSFFE